MNFVDEQDGPFPALEFSQDRFQAFLEVTAVLGTGQQGTQVQGEDHPAFQHSRYFTQYDAQGQALGHRGLANTCFAHE